MVGEVKTLTIRREAGCWYACFSVEFALRSLPRKDNAIGLDMGLETFARRSDGVPIENPRYYRKAQARLRRGQRKVARRVHKGSKRRRKAILLLQKAHTHITNQRKDFQHQESYKLVQNFGTIVVEDLNVQGLSGGMLSKAVHDVGWSSFLNMLSYKAENAGRQLLKVDPKYTSQENAPTATPSRRNISGERVHRCDCGLTLHRDHAAALVLLGRGLRLQAQTILEAECVA